jgi:predicted dehydrogenase
VAKQWRCAVVGAGVVGSTHVRVIPTMESAKLVAVVDHKRESAEASLNKAEVTGVPVYTTLAEMIRAEKPDVVHIATPSGAHMEVAVEALDAGVNVICEKPIDVTLDRADRMIEAAGKGRGKLACIFQNRWNDTNRAIKAAADEGRFGTVAWAGSFTPWYRTDKYYEDGGWRGTWKWDGGGAIMNQSVHAIDLLQWIAGPVRRVSAYSASRIHPKIEVEDTLSCSLQFKSGAFGTILGSTALYPGQPVRIEIGGENGTAVSEQGLKVFSFRDARPGDKELLAKLAPSAAAAGATSNNAVIANQLHVKNIQAIFEAWDAGREAETYGPEARKALAIVLAMYESAKRDGEPVDVK